MNKKMIFTCVFLIFLSGCSSMGEDKYSDSYIKSHVTENKTTKAEVQALYGVPDEQSTTASSTTWYYRKGGSYGALSTIANYIPGAGAVSGAIGMAGSAQSDADNLQKASNKMTGNSAHSDNSLRFSFNERGVVTDWHLY